MGDQYALDPGDDADAGDHTRADGELGAPGRQRGQLEEGRVPVEQQLQPLAGEQPAAVAVPLLVAGAAAGAGQVELLLELLEHREGGAAVGAVRLAGGVLRRAEHGALGDPGVQGARQ